jgi:hypothetical protein
MTLSKLSGGILSEIFGAIKHRLGYLKERGIGAGQTIGQTKTSKICIDVFQYFARTNLSLNGRHIPAQVAHGSDAASTPITAFNIDLEIYRAQTAFQKYIFDPNAKDLLRVGRRCGSVANRGPSDMGTGFEYVCERSPILRDHP